MSGPAQMTIRMRRVVNAPASSVFAAWTEPQAFARWWGPRGFSVPEASIDPRPGGGYRIAMQPPEGELFHASGEFREVGPSRIVYTFNWEPPDAEDVETLVIVELEEMGGRTAVDVSHGVFATERRRALHEAGWTDCLDRLEEMVAGEPASSRI